MTVSVGEAESLMQCCLRFGQCSLSVVNIVAGVAHHIVIRTMSMEWSVAVIVPRAAPWNKQR